LDGRYQIVCSTAFNGKTSGKILNNIGNIKD
jgi:hypothetical protein